MTESRPPSRPSDLGFTPDIDALFLDPAKEAQEASLDRKSRPIEIVRALTRKLGREWILWEPETLWPEIRRIFGVALTEPLKAKIQATKALLVTDAFWRDHLAFEKVVMAFNNHTPLFDAYQNPSPAEIANALEEASKIRSGRFSDEVLRYVAVSCYQDGLILLPEPLDVAQEHLDELTSQVVGRQFVQDLRRRWSEQQVNEPSRDMYSETVTGVQLARMRAIQEYVRTF